MMVVLLLVVVVGGGGVVDVDIVSVAVVDVVVFILSLLL
jgi:hypothetical protein